MSVALNTSPFVVYYDPKSVESLRQGLITYRQRLESDVAFSDFYCQVRFEVISGCDDRIGSLYETKLANLAFGYSDGNTDGIQAEQTLSSTHLTSESAFFLRACQYPQLEEQLTQTAKLICQVSRNINDSSEMWISECEVFGMLPLFMIAITYPSNAYLFGGYIIPYWDSEHAPLGEDMLALLASHLGYNQHTLKAFCYCDNTSARARMFSLEYLSHHGVDSVQNEVIEGGLLGVFRRNPDEFNTFKSLLKQRFAEQDYLQYTDDTRYYQEHPVESFIYTIMSPSKGDDYYDRDEYHQVLLGNFINSPGDEVAAELKLEIEQYLGRSIVAPKVIEDEDDYYRDNYYIYGTGEQDWKAFVTDGFEHGRDIWHFVETGENPSILDQVTPCDMAAVAKAGNFNIHKKIAYHVGGFDTYHAEMASIIYDLIVDWSDEDDGEEIVANNRLKLLRMFDVLHHWNGKQAFHPDFANEIVETYELLTDDAFIARYNSDWQALLVRHIGEFSGYSSAITHDEFKRCYTLIQSHRSDIIVLLTKLTKTQDFDAVTHMALCAAIVEWDNIHQQHDELSLYALNQLELNLETLIYRDLNETSHFICHTDDKPYSYDTPNSEDLAKAADDWQFIQGFLTQQHDHFEEALARFEPQLIRHERKESINPAQPYYEFLRNFSDNAQKLLVCAQVGAHIDNFALQSFCTRFVSLWLRVAPCKTTRMLADFFSDPEVKKPKASADLVKQLDALTPLASLAYQIETIVDSIGWDDDEATLLAPFFKQWLTEQNKQHQQQCIRLALRLILPRNEQQFYIALQKANPELTIRYFDETVHYLMMDSIRRQIHSAYSPSQSNKEDEAQDLQQFNSILATTAPLTTEQVTTLLALCDKYRVNEFDTLYGMAELETLFYYTSSHLQDAIMRLFAARPRLGLTHLYCEDKTTQAKLCQKMLEHGANIHELLSYSLDQGWDKSLPWFAEQPQISQYTDKLNLEELLKLLESLARYPECQSLIDHYAAHNSRNVRDLVADIQAGKYSKTVTSNIEIINYGIFVEGATEEELEEIKQEQEESDCLLFYKIEHRKETLQIDNELNRSFGLQLGYFADDDNEDELAPELELTIKLHHPYMHSEDGYLSEWTTTISLGRLTYVGWTMSDRALSICGIYRFEIYAPSGVLVSEKTFHVMENKPRYVAELTALLDDESIDIAHIGSLTLANGELDFMQYNQSASGLILGNKLQASVTQVYRYQRQDQLEMVDIRLNQTQPDHWYPAANQLYPYLESRIKGKTLLVGEPSSIKAAQQCTKTWRKKVTKTEAVHLIQPDESNASNVLAVHLARKGMRVYLGYSASGELCRVAIVNIKFGLLRRFFIRVMNKISKKIIHSAGIYQPL
ncbi:hypothetical protein [Photobacterium sanguinicancri]|uniref:hypothetical protein n=1 Tax=Photobacterium sanguinicancri TaxID=875932 RepID=UPI003D126F87